MKIITAIVCLVLAMWIAPASSQETKTFEMTVGLHESVHLNDEDVDKIFAEASKLLEPCNVRLRRKGSVGTFEAPNNRGEIDHASDRDAVFKENFDVKIVSDKEIFCRPHMKAGVDSGGCTWDPAPGKNKTRHKSGMIISNRTIKISGATLAHEFGHRTGLWHRSEKTALMTACPVEHLVNVEHVQIDHDNECDCMLKYPRSCHHGEPKPRAECPDPLTDPIIVRP